MVHQHPAAGVEMLADVPFPWDVLPMMRGHHERWDGRGYPDRLAGEDIPLAARILCIADVYDALTTERSYKRAFSHLEAMEIMRREAGKQFDPHLFARFEELVRRGAASRPRPRRATRCAAWRRAARRPSEEDDLTGALVRRAFVNVTAAVLAERRRTGAPGVAARGRRGPVQAGERHVRPPHGRRRAAPGVECHSGAAATRAVRGSLRRRRVRGAAAGRGCRGGRGVRRPVRRATAAAPMPVREDGDKTLTVTLSIGVATAPLHGESFETMFTAADRALFEAKREGRDKVVGASAATDGPPQLGSRRFVGRAHELRALARRWTTARMARRRCAS